MQICNLCRKKVARRSKNFVQGPTMVKHINILFKKNVLPQSVPLDTKNDNAVEKILTQSRNVFAQCPKKIKKNKRVSKKLFFLKVSLWTRRKHFSQPCRKLSDQEPIILSSMFENDKKCGFFRIIVFRQSVPLDP